MQIVTESLNKKTKGDGDLINITADIQRLLSASGLTEGLVTVFVVGSTAAITTFEYEPGLIQDIKNLYEKIIPKKQSYAHDDTWGDANGFSHLRAALQGPALAVPFKDNMLLLGTWQQVVLAEFDNRPRERKIVVQLIGQKA